jgi:AIG2-like family
MWPPWLWKDAPSAHERGRAQLKGWTIRFRKASRDGSAKADIAKVGGVVWGALFDIATDDLGDLNRKEGGYEPVPVTVHDASAKQLEAWTYVTTSTEQRARLRPYGWYLDLVRQGATHFALPKAYRTALEARRGKRDDDADRVAAAIGYLKETPRR